jgi:hypothetical protein
MCVADALTISGLIIDVFGAILLIGIDWRWTVYLGELFNPKFERLDSALDTLGNYPREDLEPDDEGFDDLFDILNIEPSHNQIPLYETNRTLIKAPEDSKGKVKFIHETDNGRTNYTLKSTDKIPIKLLDEIVNQHIQRWFIRHGVAVLVIGFGLQIIATLIPYFPDQL